MTSERDADWTLYGVGGDSINRRILIGTLAALALPTPAVAKARRPTTLWWRGTAHLEVGGRSLDIAADTSLTVPLLQVRSTTYILGQGPATARTLIIEPDGSWIDRGGQRRPLPAQLGSHERQQYAMYAWLLLVQQANAIRRRAEHARSRKLRLTAPPWPDIVFDIGRDGYPMAAEWTVEDAEPGKPAIPQRVVFSGRIDSNGVRWPTRFTLTQRGQPYFDLKITEFRAS